MRDGDVTYGDIYAEYCTSNPTDALNVVDYRPCHPPYHPVFIPMTIIVYYDKNDTRVQNLYTYKGETKC